jgi:hypothetical protein
VATRRPTPVWLLDVDGVLNVARPGWGRPPRQGRAVALGVSYQLRWAPGLVDRIVRLHKSGTVEVRWATTWVDHIGEIERLLRLPAFPPAFTGLGAAPFATAPDAKLAVALGVVEFEQRPLIWTDDDSIPTSGPILERLAVSGLPVLLVAPDPLHGLQPEHLRAIEEFLADSGPGGATGREG